MGTACKPPTCRNCGVAEWRHLCRGALDIKEIETKAAARVQATADKRKAKKKGTRK